MSTVRAEVTGRRASTSAVDADAYSIEEFCRRHSISKSTFYNLKRLSAQALQQLNNLAEEQRLSFEQVCSNPANTKLVDQLSLAPRTAHVLGRELVTKEAGADWRRAREATVTNTETA